MTLQELTDGLDKVQSIEEETYELFSQEPPTGNLGFVDSKAPSVQVAVAGHDLTIHQSPAVLSSNRSGGTTGAVLWKITPVFADWISRPDNIFFTTGALDSRSTVIELGCGIAAVVGLLLAPKVSRYVLTDQPYVAKLVEQNLAENADVLSGKSGHGVIKGPKSRGRKAKGGVVGVSVVSGAGSSSAQIAFRPLDWETDTVDVSLAGSDGAGSFDAVVACDCIYNEALIEPFVQTCADICRLRADDDDDGDEDEETGRRRPCLCIVGQHLRDSDVCEAFLNRFTRDFEVWRVPDSRLVEGLRSNSSFVVHVGVLKG